MLLVCSLLKNYLLLKIMECYYCDWSLFEMMVQMLLKSSEINKTNKSQLCQKEKGKVWQIFLHATFMQPFQKGLQVFVEHLTELVISLHICGSNRIWTHNHLVHEWTLNHLAKLVKWLSFVVSTYLYGAFDCTLS